MYYKDRQAAGKLLAHQISRRYKGKPCVVIALSDGGVLVGMQVALRLGCPIMLLHTEHIDLPREHEPIGGITPDGSFTYNSAYSTGELDELSSEYFSLIEQEKFNQVGKIHRAMSKGILMRQDLLTDRHVILVTDGLQDGFALDMAVKFLKPIRTKSVVVATPLASVPAVDHMHIQTDEIFCLDVVKDYMDTDHYYDAHDVPEHDEVVRIIDRILSGWQSENADTYVTQNSQDM